MFELTNEERWEQVEGHAGLYLVSDLGRVRQLFTAGPRSKEYPQPTLRDDGYLVISLLSQTGRRRGWLLHRLVLTAFRGSRPSTMHAAHLNGDRADNRLVNLSWCTPKENEAHKIEHGRAPKGERNGMAKLTPEAVQAIRDEYRPRSRTRGCLPLARKYGLCFQHVADLVSGRRWNHLTTPTKDASHV